MDEGKMATGKLVIEYEKAEVGELTTIQSTPLPSIFRNFADLLENPKRRAEMANNQKAILEIIRGMRSVSARVDVDIYNDNCPMITAADVPT